MIKRVCDFCGGDAKDSYIIEQKHKPVVDIPSVLVRIQLNASFDLCADCLIEGLEKYKIPKPHKNKKDLVEKSGGDYELHQGTESYWDEWDK